MSRLAVAALLLGAASPVVFVGPPATVLIPLAGVVAGALAVRRTGRDAPLAGRRVAAFGLALAVLSLAAGPTYWLVRECQLRRTAEEVARRFVERLLAGDLRAAHQMTLPTERRFATDQPLAESYREHAAARDDLARFADEEAVRRLRALADAPVSRVEVEWHESRRSGDGFGVLVESQTNADEPPAFSLRLIVERAAREAGDEWIVRRFFLEGGDEAK